MAAGGAVWDPDRLAAVGEVAAPSRSAGAPRRRPAVACRRRQRAVAAGTGGGGDHRHLLPVQGSGRARRVGPGRAGGPHGRGGARTQAAGRGHAPGRGDRGGRPGGDAPRVSSGWPRITSGLAGWLARWPSAGRTAGLDPKAVATNIVLFSHPDPAALLDHLEAMACWPARSHPEWSAWSPMPTSTTRASSWPAGRCRARSVNSTAATSTVGAGDLIGEMPAPISARPTSRQGLAGRLGHWTCPGQGAAAELGSVRWPTW